MKDEREISLMSVHSTENPWGSDIIPASAWSLSTSFSWGRAANYILGLVDVQVLRGVQSQNTETIKHQML